MKILFLSEFFPVSDGGPISGGAESRTYYLAKSLSQKHDVSVVTSLINNSQKFETWNKLKIYRIGKERQYLRKMGLLDRGVFFLSAVYKTIFLDFDIIDANNGVVYFCAWIVSKLKNKKLVYWVPDMVGLKEWQREQGFVGGIIARAMEMTAVWFPADKIIAFSETTKNKIDKNNVAVIYPGV